MRNLIAASGALALAVLAIGPLGARADDKVVPAPAPAVPDATIPFNPVDGSVVGDWTQYAVADPGSPERFPEVFATRAIESGEVVLVDKMTESFRFKSGEPGRSATAFLRGFFGASADPYGLRGLTVTAEPVVVRGRRYASAARLDATVVRPMTAEAGKPAEEMRTEVSIWLAPGVRAPGVVRAVATVTLLGEVRRGRIELVAEGAANTPQPRLVPGPDGELVGETPTAAPAATPTAAPTGAAAPAGARVESPTAAPRGN